MAKTTFKSVFQNLGTELDNAVGANVDDIKRFEGSANTMLPAAIRESYFTANDTGFFVLYGFSQESDVLRSGSGKKILVEVPVRIILGVKRGDIGETLAQQEAMDDRMEDIYDQFDENFDPSQHNWHSANIGNPRAVGNAGQAIARMIPLAIKIPRM